MSTAGSASRPVADESDPFRGYHRHAAWMTLARRSAIVAGATALVTALSLLVGAAPPPSEVREQPLAAPVEVAAVVDALPAPAPAGEPAEPPDSELPATGHGTWSITIDTTGHQAEVDACLWVRMDLGAVAPIVGAHNYCGGDVVLGMVIGDVVELHGTSLDGAYEVVESRDAWAGQSAAAATDGMAADVILQTCYWHSGGKERLLALVRA